MAGDFEKMVANFAIKTKGKAEAIPKRFALEMLTRIVMGTPVITGRLKGNNQIGINRQPNSILAEEDKDGGKTIDTGKAVLENFKMGDTIYITNNVIYAYFVEFGFPKPRTPRAMFTNAVNEMVAEWDGLVVKEVAK